MRTMRWSLLGWFLAACLATALRAGSDQPAQPSGHPAQHPAAHPAGHHWGYEGAEGPQKWGSLEKEFAACATGRHQSPIDIQDPEPADLPAIQFDYQPSPLKMIDNGHTIQVNFAPGSRITVGQDTYELVQLHFHHPGENTMDKRAFPMEAHLVHKDAQGRLAVVALLLQEGKANAFLATLWEHMPTAKGQEQAANGVTIDPSTFLPQDRGYDTFPGSLTTPPCSEGVTWFVLKTPVEVGKEQVNRFAQIYKMNARPVQPLNDRVVQATR
jgi:carbonic anhydrase